MSDDLAMSDQEAIADYLRKWTHAEAKCDQAALESKKAQAELAGYRDALGSLIVPDDFRPGEKFHCWIGSVLVCASFMKDEEGVHRYDISIRKGRVKLNIK